MFILRLFHRDNPFEQIEARSLAEGELTVGRDPDADWPLADSERTLSRIHCRLQVVDGKLWASDHSRNGTFLAKNGRMPSGKPVELILGETIRLGDLRILVDAPRSDAVGDATVASLGPIPTGETERGGDKIPHGSARAGLLLEAFCKGAGLDPSSLSSEDPEELMRRAGAIYQESVSGLSMLMMQRARMKSSERLERTTIGAADNNPFKWAPTRKLAQVLLCGVEPGFLSDADAVRASFLDLATHLSAVSKEAGAATQAMLAALDPDTIEAQAKVAPSLLRSRSAACWDIYSQRHRELTSGGGDPRASAHPSVPAGDGRANDKGDAQRPHG